MISNSGHDENGQYSGGRAGDQTGQEWRIQVWYSRPWTVVLRHPNELVRKQIALNAKLAAENDLIGYNQDDRYSYWNNLKVSNYDPSQIKTPCNADCSAGVTANIKATGYTLGIKELKNVSIYSYTGNLKANLVSAGFKALTNSKYLSSDKYLEPGDILLCENHHVATNLDTGVDVLVWYESEITTEGLKVMEDLSVRQHPSITSKVLDVIPKGTIIFPKGKAQYDGKWWVNFGTQSQSEWLSMSYLRGWIREGDRWWYLLGEGEYDYYKSIVARIDGKDYAFDKDGWMITADRIDPSGAIK